MQAAAEPPQGFDWDLAVRSLEAMRDALLRRVPYLVVALLVALAFYFIGKLIKGALHAAGERTQLDVQLADLLGSLTVVVFTTLGAFIAAVVVFPTFRPGDLIAGLGITSVAIGFAFRDILQNFFAGILILWRKPFRIGDQIQTREYEGTVEEINVRSTRLRTYDGERVVIPNGDVYTSAILVRTAYDRRRVRFTVGIGYPDSIEEARETIMRVVTGVDGVLDNPGPWVYVSELAPSSVNFTVYFWVEPEQANVLAVSDRVVTAIKLALDEAGIDIPYPHTVVLFHDALKSQLGDAAQTRDREHEVKRRYT